MKKLTNHKAFFKTYQSVKQKYPDAIILLRTGEDYTSFNDDAQILQQLTGNSLQTIPGIGNTCCFPFAELNNILNKLVKAGNKVALCDQLE